MRDAERKTTHYQIVKSNKIKNGGTNGKNFN